MTITIDRMAHAPAGAWREVKDVWRELLAPSDDSSDEFPKTTRLYRAATVALYLVVMACMVAIGVVVLVQAVIRSFQRGLPFSLRVSNALGGLILAVIISELLETVFKQLIDRERLSVLLVNNFLIIGAVSAVRHVLVIGASLADQHSGKEGVDHTNEIGVLYANVILVAVLLAGIWLIRGMVEDARKRDPKK